MEGMLTTEETAAMMGISAESLACMRAASRGPAFYKDALQKRRRIYYALADVTAWIEAHPPTKGLTRIPTKEQA